MIPKTAVLVASPDTKIRELARSALSLEGFEPILCGDGAEAIESTKSQNINEISIKLIVLEALLPKIDGFEVVKQLEGFPATQETPILMLIDPKKDQPQGNISIRLNADDYLEKPLELGDIRQKIHGMVRHFRPHKAPHPVTGLGGHPQLEGELFAHFNRGENFTTLWIDINYFRPFNDHYGQQQGDAVIRMMVQLIGDGLRSLQVSAQQAPFLAHVDGDDFILLVSAERANAIRELLRIQFQTEVQKFYSKEERKQGFFYEKGRDQKDQIFPLMNLSTVLLEVPSKVPFRYGEFISKANELLRQSKVGSQDVK